MNINTKQLPSLLLVVGLLFLSSCLKETAVPIASSFEVTIAEDKTSPVTVKLQNNSYGADEYEWTFEGGVPASSRDRAPESVTFTEAGEHKIRLRVWNAVDERVSEQVIRVDSAMSIDFDYAIAINDIAPGVVSISNKSRGGSRYEWTFEGGNPSSSTEQYPSAVTFADGGIHRIHLKVFNGSRYEEQSKSFTLQPAMQADFDYEPIAVDQDWEAPLTLQTRNRTSGGLSYRWSCEGATIDNAAAEHPSVRFERAGIYRLRLIASNGKEDKVVEKTLTIKPNSGLVFQQDLKFGINEAKNSIGCFYSSRLGGVLTSQRIAQENVGASIDFGFFALNSSFNYCYFFSPLEARANAFPAIPNAIASTFVNSPSAMGILVSNDSFEALNNAQALSRFTQWAEPRRRHFTKAQTPHFVLFRTSDGRRGIIRVKGFVEAGAQSYILADVKMEKRLGE